MGTLHRIGQEVVKDEVARRVSARYCTVTALLEDNDRAIMATRENWIAVKNVFDCDWFKRLWVIQEINLASHAVVKLGYCDIPLRTLEAAFYWIWAYVTQHIKVFDQIDFPRLAFLMERGPSHTLVPLINYTKFSLCSNSRDRVYATMSLLDPRHRLGIEPDYRLSPEEIYKDFTLRFIKANSFLDVLQLCTMRGQGLPSWVLNLSIPNPTEPFLYSHTSSISRHDLEDHVDGWLSIHGVHTSSIDYVGSGVPQGAQRPEILELCHSWEPKDVVTAPYRHGGTMLDAYLTTLAGGLIKGMIASNIGSFLSIENCRSFFHYCIRGRQAKGLSNSQRLYFKGSRLDALQQFLPGRAFFTTADGYIGLCPADARPGDHICEILGCKTHHYCFDPWQVMTTVINLWVNAMFMASCMVKDCWDLSQAGGRGSILLPTVPITISGNTPARGERMKTQDLGLCQASGKVFIWRQTENGRINHLNLTVRLTTHVSKRLRLVL